MKVKQGGGGAGTGAESAPGASGLSVELKPEPQPQEESETGSESEPEVGPGPRPGPLQRRQPIGPEDVLGLQRITGGEHWRGRAPAGGRGPSEPRPPPPFPPSPCLTSPSLTSPTGYPSPESRTLLPSSLRSPCPPLSLISCALSSPFRNLFLPHSFLFGESSPLSRGGGGAAAATVTPSHEVFRAL